MTSGEDRRGPGLRFPPPLIPAVFIGGGWLTERGLPLPITAGTHSWWPGAVLLGMAALIVINALLHFRRAKTHVEPWQPTSRIVDGGVFRFSRNPIYLAFCIATLGCGLLLNNGWILLAALPVAGLLQTLVIRKEERYLEARFGATYLDYKQRVRRWL